RGSNRRWKAGPRPGPYPLAPITPSARRAGGGGTGLPHSRQHLLDGGFEQQAFLGHRPAIHQDGEFATLPVYQLHFHARLLLQGGRQTGGVLANPASNRALTDRYLFHGSASINSGRSSRIRRT